MRKAWESFVSYKRNREEITEVIVRMNPNEAERLTTLLQQIGRRTPNPQDDLPTALDNILQDVLDVEINR
jgi:hypothetical protein